MAPRELFGVGVRLTGLVAAVGALPALLGIPLNVGAAAQVVLGLILITRAEMVVDLSYGTDRRKALDDKDDHRS